MVTHKPLKPADLKAQRMAKAILEAEMLEAQQKLEAQQYRQICEKLGLPLKS